MMPMTVRVRARITASLAVACLFAMNAPALASSSSSGMPWETPLTTIQNSLQGPVAKAIAVIVIITTGLSLAFGDGGGGFRRLIQIVFGLSIAFGAVSILTSVFQFSGGALI
jgi:type IV secretion system protein VirB2